MLIYKHDHLAQESRNHRESKNKRTDSEDHVRQFNVIINKSSFLYSKSVSFSKSN